MCSLFVSKETEDKVKLAKKYIQDKYQSLLTQQRQQKQNWDKILHFMTKNKVSDDKKSCIEKQLKIQQRNKKRLMRQKDSLKNYELFQLIGRGAFGQVRLARNKATNEIVAIKRMQKQKLVKKKQISSAYVERQLMIKNINSKFLVNLHSTFQDKSYLYLVMEYVSGGDLLHLLIQKDIFTQNQTKFYMAQLILALQQIHSRNFIHRDIKPDNILISKNGHIKISDFGLSKHMVHDAFLKQRQQFQRYSTNKKQKNYNLFKKQHACLQKLNMIRERCQRTYSKVGTPDYISPEVLTSNQYDYSIDIWSVGVIMFQCLFGYPPFADDDPKEVCQKVVNWVHNLQFPPDMQVSLEAKLLILGMINSRQKRLSIKQIKQHPFFQGIQWNKIFEMKPSFIPTLSSQLDTRNFQKYDSQASWINQNQDEFVDQEFCQDSKYKIDNFEIQIKKRSSSADYLFAGFEYKNVSLQPFKVIENQLNKNHKKKIQKIHEIKRNSCKSPQIMKKSVKRFHTEQSQHFNKCSNKIVGKNRSEKYLIKIPTSTKNIYSKFNQTANTFLHCTQTTKMSKDLNCIKQNTRESLKKESQFNSKKKLLTCSKIASKKLI